MFVSTPKLVSIDVLADGLLGFVLIVSGIEENDTQKKLFCKFAIYSTISLSTKKSKRCVTDGFMKK